MVSWCFGVFWSVLAPCVEFPNFFVSTIFLCFLGDDNFINDNSEEIDRANSEESARRKCLFSLSCNFYLTCFSFGMCESARQT